MFACDHVVLRFWDELISDLQSKRILQCSERLAYMKDLADYRIRQTPRSITCTATNEPDELIVQWDFLEQKRVPKDSIITILHSLDCEESALIHRDDDQGMNNETMITAMRI